MDLIDLYEDDFEMLYTPRRESVFHSRLDAFNIYDDNDFLKRYRFTKDGVNDLTFLLKDDLRRATRRRKAISVEHQILAALRFYGSGGPYQLLDGDSLGYSQPTISRVITAVSTALCRRVDDYIKIPTAGYASDCKRNFYDIANFPGVIGCIDGTHVAIQEPSENPEQYRNRKGYTSINVQVACDPRYKFINIVAKWPGSTHDSFMLRQSNLWDYFQENRHDGLILGDSAYPCKYWLMTPYSHPDTPIKANFNKAHKRTRVRIEMTIGQWKRRFGLLKVQTRRSLANCLRDTVACAVLHNLAKDWNMPEVPGEDDLDFEDIEVAHVANYHTADAGARRRDAIANAHFI